jgi:hypothetical protein
MIGKPTLVDKLKPDLGAKLVDLIIKDNERAQKARDEKRKKAARKRSKAK